MKDLAAKKIFIIISICVLGWIGSYLAQLCNHVMEIVEDQLLI